MRAQRLLDAPLIESSTHPSLGPNIQGPSLVRIPDWLEGALGRYYLYFADHKGAYIRLAHADALTGPFTVHPPGSLQLADSHFPTEPPETPPGALEKVRRWAEETGLALPHGLEEELTAPHIASPDVHVDEANRRFVMYFHGLEAFGYQQTRVATSVDGIHYAARRELLGKTYWRAFRDGDTTYALAMPGQLYRSREALPGFALSGFEPGACLFEPDMRHAALLVRDRTLHVFWTRVGDVPERIFVSTIDLSRPFEDWVESDPVEVLRPERAFEGAAAPLVPSMRSTAYGKVNQLRDPAIFEDEGRVYLLYAVAGESGIALAELHLT